MKATYYRDVSEKFRKEWQQLWQKSESANMVNSPAWFTAAVQISPKKAQCIIAVYNDNESLIAVAPFVKSKVFGMPVYTTPGSEFADRSCLLVKYSNAALIKFIISAFDKLGIVYLTEFEENQLLNIQPAVSNGLFFPSTENPYIDFSDGNYGIYPNKKRNHILNRAKTVQEKITIIHADGKNHKALLDAFNIEKKSVKYMNGKGVLAKKEAQNFYTALAKENASHLLISVLYFGKKPVSYCIGFIFRNIYQGSQKAYVQGYDYYYPGKLLFLNLVDYCRSLDMTQLDLGSGNDRFKKDFTKKTRNHYNLVYTNKTFVRFYIHNMYKIRMKFYKTLVAHKNIYRWYKQIKRNNE